MHIATTTMMIPRTNALPKILPINTSSRTVGEMDAIDKHYYIFCHGYKPWQDCPFPSYPALQVQLKLPRVFIQSALRSQLCKPRLHSSTSVIKIIENSKKLRYYVYLDTYECPKDPFHIHYNSCIDKTLRYLYSFENNS